ncbi:putative protein N(5)-glutamine methyltransferase [Lentzea tibetensis]|uniref:peptide chain release factor N(5)-glutamine methyltransferase n=1 Tax=Lentzea tibetensis TaxID=2591470 RepID=A0A563EQG2_9PSEU|nr:putative protein N(5)-glutamine methyltransferase [Lentzea tibetensis]TWP49647.1 putative protein N(5)-glutamine methyltransferase [Lentzea tibetensis]
MISASIILKLRAAGCVFAEDEARLLVSTARDAAELDSMVSQRVAGLPLEHVLGWAEFCGLRVTVAPGVFVPRRRTEFLVEQALSLSPPDPVIVDLCCGSGAVGAALLAARPSATLYAADIDPAAVRCARHNVPLVLQGDLYEPLPKSLRGKVNVLVVNAPYVPTSAIPLMPPEARDHEPQVALDGGEDGLDVQRRVAREAPRWLAPGGHLLIETSTAQAPLLRDVFTAAGLHAKIVSSDQATVVTGRLGSSH